MRTSPHPASRFATRRRHRTVALLISLVVVAAACGADDSDASTASVAAAPDPPATAAATTEPAADTTPTQQSDTTPEPTDPSTTTGSAPSTTVDAGPSDEELTSAIEIELAKAITPGVIAWNKNGIDLPPTAAVVGVRIPGRDDVFVGVGENIDGSPVDVAAPFAIAGLTESLVRTVAFQMIDSGALDPTLTVDTWLPTLPNADRVTVQMVLDSATGWSDYGSITPDPVLGDLDKAWTVREAAEERAKVMTAEGEPGTRSNDQQTNEAILGLIVEEAGGKPLAEVVRDMLTEPVGLDETMLNDGTDAPADLRQGVFTYDGGDGSATVSDTSTFQGQSFITWNFATTSGLSTPADLLDLLDAWMTGELFETDRTAAPDRFVPDPGGSDSFYLGISVPFNGFCPCTEVDGGVEFTALGRGPGTFGSRSYVWSYPDGVSVVFNVNSNEWANESELTTVVHAIHDIAAQGL